MRVRVVDDARVPIVHIMWASSEELVAFENHFGKRGTVVGEITAEFAVEIAGRLSSQQKVARAASLVVVDMSGCVEPNGVDTAVLSRSPREVAAVAYAFSELLTLRCILLSCQCCCGLCSGSSVRRWTIFGTHSR